MLAALGMLIMYSSGYDHGERFYDHSRNLLLALFIMFAVAQVPLPLIMRAAELIIQRKGVLAIADLAAELGLEKRWMERKFLDFYGVSGKRLSLLIRYQLIWQACLQDHDFNVQDTVVDYGFYDQAHLLNFFKKYHSQRLSFFSKTAKR